MEFFNEDGSVNRQELRDHWDAAAREVLYNRTIHDLGAPSEQVRFASAIADGMLIETIGRFYTMNEVELIAAAINIGM